MSHSERATFIPENDDVSTFDNDSDTPLDEKEHEPDGRDIGSKSKCTLLIISPNVYADWEPGQGVKINYAAIVEILVKQLDTQPERSCILILYTLVSLTQLF